MKEKYDIKSDSEQQSLDSVDEAAIRRAFKNWHNSKVIGQEPFAQLRIVQHQRLQSGYGETDEGYALALRDVLHSILDEVKALARPDDLTDDPWVYYTILIEQFINRRKSDAVQDELALGRRAFFNKQKQALTVVAQKLAEREAQHSSAQDVAAPPETVSPPDVGDFVGRSQELTYFQQKLDEQNCAVIVGFPGAGKTILAAKLAREVASLERIFWYQCRAGDSVESLLWALAGFLVSCGDETLWRILHKSGGQMGQDGMPLNVRIDYALRLLTKQDYLICLDDFQTIADDEDVVRFATQLYELTQTNPLRLVITSRVMPPFIRVKLDPLDGLRPDDIKLLIASHSMALPPEQVAELHTELYKATDGLPLFLNLALDVLRETGDVDALLERLPQEESIEQYLLQTVDHQLSQDERLVMCGIAVLGDYGSNRRAIELTIGGGSIRRQLTELSRRNLLTVSLGADGRKYSQHAIVRTFYHEELGLREREAMHRRAAIYYLEHEQNIIQAALQLECAGAYEELLQAITEDTLLISLDHAEQISRLYERLASNSSFDQSDPHIAYLWARVKGSVFRYQGRYHDAIAVLEGALQNELPCKIEAELLHQLGETHCSLAEDEKALKYLLKSLQYYDEQMGSIAKRASINFRVGWVYFRIGKNTEAQTYLNICLKMAEEHNDDHFIAQANYVLGGIAFRNERLTEASERFVRSRDIFRQRGDLMREAAVVNMLSFLYHRLGDTTQAIENMHEIVEASEQMGHITNLLGVYNSLGFLYCACGDHSNASKYYKKLITLAEEKQHMFLLSFGYSGLADAALLANDPEEALDFVQKAQEIAEAHNNKATLGVSYRVLGDTWLALNDFDKAQAYFAQSIPLLEETEFSEELERAKVGYQRASSQQ